MQETERKPEEKKLSVQDRTEDFMRIWERAIETQMHFAELSIKTRQIGMTVVGATLALAVVLYRTNHQFSVSFFCYSFPVSSILCWTAALVLFAIKLLDVGVYHQMLRGSVAFNEDFETKNLREFFGTEKGLTQAISFFSRHPGARLENGKYIERGRNRFQVAGDRISHFYLLLISALILAGLVLMWAGVK